MKVNPEDLGSIIAYALTSNVFLEGLAKINYMDLNEILMRQQKQKKGNSNTYELLD